jgi:hypothetical protein
VTPLLPELAAGASTILAALTTWVAVRVVARRELHASPAPYTLRYEIWPNEPWRARPDADTIGMVPTWWLRTVADPGELAGAATHSYRLRHLAPSIAKEGIHTPLVVNIDQLGRVCLADGHHRLVIAMELHVTACPVQVKAVPRIGGYGVPVGPAVATLVTQARTREGVEAPGLRR